MLVFRENKTGVHGKNPYQDPNNKLRSHDTGTELNPGLIQWWTASTFNIALALLLFYCTFPFKFGKLIVIHHRETIPLVVNSLSTILGSGAQSLLIVI